MRCLTSYLTQVCQGYQNKKFSIKFLLIIQLNFICFRFYS